MIFLGNKYKITKQEEKKLLEKVDKILYIDITDEKKVINSLKKCIKKENIKFIVLNLEKDVSIKIKSVLEELDYSGIEIMLFKQFAKNLLDRDIVEFNADNFKVYNKIKQTNL